MNRKMPLGVTALVVIAVFLGPSPASANPVLKENGTAVPAGTKILGTNVGEVTMTSSMGNITCNSAVLTATLTVNEAAKGAESDIESASVTNSGSTECSSWTGGFSLNMNPATNGLPWCVEATENSDVLKLRGGSCTAAMRPIRFVLAFTNSLVGNCTYQRSTAAIGTLKTASGEFSLSEQEWVKFEGGSGCASSMKLDMTFALERDESPYGGLTFASS